MPHLLPAAASAIAQAAPAAAATAAKATVMGTLKSVAFKALTNLAISAAMSALQPQVGGQSGRTFEFVIDPDGPIPFAAGRVGVAGSVIHRDTFGPDLMYYGMPFVLSGAGPITAIESFMADDYPMSFDANGGATTEPYRQELFFRSVLGHQPASAALTTPSGLKNGATLPGWTASHKLSGKAAGLIVMAENSKGSAFPTGEIKPLIQLLGLKGWDPTLDSTYPGGSGPCRLHDPSTWVTLTCPILWALKWSLGLWEGPNGKGAPQVDHQVGGIGAKLSGIDVPAFVAASNIAKANGWTVSAYPNTDDDKHQVLEAFLQAGGAIYSQRAGKISCISRAAPRTSIVTISAADTAGPLEIDTAASRIDRINTIRPRFWSPAHRWQMTAMEEVTAAAYQTEDGGKRTRGIDYPFVSNAKQAGQLAALQIANTREGIAGVIPLKPHLQRIRPGDAFTITEPGFVLNGLKCLCLNTDYDPATGIVRVSFVSETDAKYPFALGQDPTPPTPQVLTPVDPRFVTPPASGDWTLAAETLVENGSSIPIIAFTGACDNATAESVIFEFRPVDSPPRLWAGAGVEGPAVQRKEVGGPITQGTAYEGAVSYRRGNNVSERLVLGPVTVGAYAVSPGPAARRLVSQSIDYPFASDASSISIATAFTGVVEGSGATVSFPTGSISGLSNSTQYGVFWKADAGYEVEPYPATTHMTTGSWIFVGWQATSDGAGSFPTSPPPPPGWGGGGNTPIYEQQVA
ncbi:phage tail protein [Brevundimonas sp.]|uniref:phage tail protein n=1 Tax=Brevundimonas sp. TaxID=1871086 RepID=UPI0028AC186D|nr:phage tail protein [Brevundimonas sp.]